MSWNSPAFCNKLCDRTWRDGMGTPIHFKGYVSANEVSYPLPQLPAGFRFVSLPCWGLKIERV